MKRTILIIVAIFMMGMAWAQSAGKAGRAGAAITKTVTGINNLNKATDAVVSTAVSNATPKPAPSPVVQTPNLPVVPKPPVIKKLPINTAENGDFVAVPAYKPSFDGSKNRMLGLGELFYHRVESDFTNSFKGKKNRGMALLMLERFLSYVKIESQSVDVPELDSFPMTEGQIQIADYIFNELKAIDKDNKMEIKMSPDYYIYVKVPSNIKNEVPSVMFMAHMDVTPEANGKGIKPQVHYNYDGGDIALGNGLVLSPDNPEGRHLKDLEGKTIITSDGNTLLGADCKTGCAILVTLIEQMANDKKFKHGDVYFAFSQNEDVGKAAVRMDMNYFDRTPDILIDVDGNDFGQFSKANFTAENRSYYFKGNLAHSSHGKELKFADARTAMAFFIGQLPPEIHPSYSEGHQGYVHCYNMEMLPNGCDVRIRFRIRYFEKSDGDLYRAKLDEAFSKTKAAFPFVELNMESKELQYENVAYNMHPKAVEVIEKAAQKAGIPMVGVELRAGTTGALMVARGLPGGPCIYSAQQAVHSVYEWCCLEEMMDIVKLTKNIVTEVSKL